MKYIFFLLFFTLFQAQSKYSIGYIDGHRKGFCYAAFEHNEINCSYPFISIISPMPRINENFDSYKDGFNRGYSEGLKSYQKNPSNTNVCLLYTSDAADE